MQVYLNAVTQWLTVWVFPAHCWWRENDVCVCVIDRARRPNVWYGVDNNVHISSGGHCYPTTLHRAYVCHLSNRQMHIFSRTRADTDAAWHAECELQFNIHHVHLVLFTDCCKCCTALISVPCLIMPPPNVVWPTACCFCLVHPCVCPCVRPETLLTRYLAEHFTYFHQTYINDALWDRDERITIWCQRSRSRWHKVCWKQQFLGLLTRCIEKY